MLAFFIQSGEIMDLKKSRVSSDYNYTPWVITGVFLGIIVGAIFDQIATGVFVGGAIGILIGYFISKKEDEF